MRIPIIAGNWKMHKTPTQAAETARNMLPELDKLTAAERVLCPPYLAIPSVAAVLATYTGTAIKLGAQNVHTDLQGAFTGSISAPMLRELVDYVIVGHSEVRKYNGDTDLQINRKVKVAIDNALKPILAVGESLVQRQAGQAETIVRDQIRADLEGVSAESMPQMVIAYEPIWAIGTGLSATSAQANDIIGAIRYTLTDLYGSSVAQMVRIQYGGSVKADNMREFMSQSEIDGALVGGASLNGPDFVNLVRLAIEAKGL